MNAEALINALHAAFDYTADNNRDLLSDELFPLSEVVEGLNVEFCYRFLVAYIARNSAMIDQQLQED
jgi:hypothetical protein